MIGNFAELISRVCGLFVDMEDEVIIKKIFEIISFNYDTEE
jgi:poly(A) polymerase Pap1